ncbi:MAG: hypothetical protein ACFFAZ_03675 [Promethearchaeota archaeon]
MKKNAIFALASFLALLFTVVVGLAFNLRLGIETSDLDDLKRILRITNIIDT